jgi:hypothetical protein
MDAEERARLLEEAEKEENKRPIKGYSPAAFEKDGRIVAGLEKNQPGDTPGWHKPKDVHADIPKLEKPKKRENIERAQALGARLWNSAQEDPVQMHLLLQRIQGYLWEQGKPVSFEEVQRLAGELLAVAEKQAKATRD